MEQQAYLGFLEKWNLAMWGLAGLSIAMAILLFLAYQAKYASIKDFKAKFDFASQNEIRRYLIINFSLASTIFFVVNMASENTVAISFVWFFIRIFIGVCFGTLYGYIAFLVFSYYYPRKLQKKLDRLRYTPRVNPSTGNKMKLLSEDEEDAYLDEGMQAEEDVFSVDYDVWIDEKTGETKIEKYKGHLSALECDRCGFQTLKLEKEEVLRESTDTRDGELEKEYHCSYCGRIKRKTVNITANISTTADDKSSSNGNSKHVDAVKVEIHSNKGDIQVFEFHDIEQASHFLHEFDYGKLGEEQEEA